MSQRRAARSLMTVWRRAALAGALAALVPAWVPSASPALLRSALRPAAEGHGSIGSEAAQAAPTLRATRPTATGLLGELTLPRQRRPAPSPPQRLLPAAPHPPLLRPTGLGPLQLHPKGARAEPFLKLAPVSTPAVTLPALRTPSAAKRAVTVQSLSVPSPSVPPLGVPQLSKLLGGTPPAHTTSGGTPPVSTQPSSTPSASSPSQAAEASVHSEAVLVDGATEAPGGTAAGSTGGASAPGKAPRRGRRARGPHAGSNGSSASPAAGAGGAGSLNLARPARGAARAVRRRPVSRPRAHGGSATIHTIERLIGVIPKPIWIALGILALLTFGLAGGSWLAVARVRRSERQRRRLTADVGALQAALLPVVPERIAGVGVSVAYRPADGPAAGGDFYDVFELKDGRLAVIVGDVSGHGRAALPQTALIRYTLRAYLDAGIGPRAALRAGAGSLDRDLGGTLATVVLAVYDPGARTLTYSCAGHPPPLLIGTTTLEPTLECCSPPVGMGAASGLRETVVRLPGRAQVCFYTDGLVEARVGGDLFGVERLECAARELGAGAGAATLLQRVVERSDRRPDDMAACVLSLPGAALAPVLCSEELELAGERLDWHAPERFLRGYGVSQARVAELMRALRAAVNRGECVLLRMRLDGAVPEVRISRSEARDASLAGASSA